MKQTLPDNSTISHYRILSLLGVGGMGEVYLAEDTNLRRKVALKILSPDLTRSDDRLRRFKLEAYAASALSHPNILVVYDIGFEADMHFIAAEYVEGKTLRQMAQAGMNLRTALDVATQVAGALAAAHKAGIVHRDIKPENIMQREDGYVKLLDFGLAKLIEQPAGDSDATVGTRTQLGTVIGTVNYMSPEQVLGREVDARADIFSLGVVLYEMVAGRRPFEGVSSGEVMASILKQYPAPLARYAPETPSELERILDRALRKDREERYQSAKDLLLDLKSLREDLQVSARLERLSQDSGVKPALGTGSGLAAPAPPGPSAIETGAPAAAHPVSSAEYIASEIRQHKRGALLIVAVLIAGLLGGVFALHKLFERREPAVSSKALKITQLAETGKVQRDAAISPDGKYVAYVHGDAAQQSLWIRQVTTAAAANLQILPAAEVQYWGIAFSPESDSIYYVQSEKADPLTGVLYQRPVLGGGSRKLLEDVSSPLTLSPEGKRFAFMRALRGQGKMVLMVANVDGTGERQLATLRAAGFLPEHGPSWSPDGARIAFVDLREDPETVYGILSEIAADTGAKKDISSRKFYHAQQVAWLSDGSGLLLAGQDRPTAFAPQIWHVSYPDGEAHRITQQLDNYSSISLNRDSSALVAMQWRALSSIWIAALDSPDSASRIQSQIGSVDGKYGLSWLPNDRIAFVSNVSGNWVILVSNLRGDQKQLTFEAFGDYDPAASPDGRYLVFASNRGGGRSIWRMDFEGSNLKRLTQGVMDWLPHCSPDGKWVVYVSLASGKRTIWKVGIDGGQPVQLTDKLSNMPVYSPDGNSVACLYSEERRNSRMKIAIIPSAGGPPTKLLDLPPSAETLITSVRWMPDGNAVAYVDTREGVSNIWVQPLKGGAPRQLTHFTSDLILKFDLSADGKRIACARGGNASDVVLIKDFR